MSKAGLNSTYSVLFTALVLTASLLAPPFDSSAAQQGTTPLAAEATRTNSFPDLTEVFQGRSFTTKFEKEVFFLRRIRESYPAYWSPLLAANITVNDYVQAPAKLLRFVEVLGTALARTNDLAASTKLALITSDPVFYANTNAYQPDILRAAASALLKIGPNGWQALARSFNQDHYRLDPNSLEELVEVIGGSGISDPDLVAALAATTFAFTATNNGYYPRCTEAATKNLLRLPNGIAALGVHLNAKEAFDDPGRFQAVVDGIASARPLGLTTNLATLEGEVAAKLATLTNSPGPYRDELQDLHVRIGRTVAQLQESPRKNPTRPN